MRKTFSSTELLRQNCLLRVFRLLSIPSRWIHQALKTAFSYFSKTLFSPNTKNKGETLKTCRTDLFHFRCINPYQVVSMPSFLPNFSFPAQAPSLSSLLMRH